MKCKNKLVNCTLLLAVFFFGSFLTGCSSVSRSNFVQPVEGFSPGKILFSEEDIYLNLDQIEDRLLCQQIFQGLEPRIASFNLKSNPEGERGHLVITVNQRSFWEGYYQRNSIAITGTIYAVGKALENGQQKNSETSSSKGQALVQQTVLITGKNSMIKVKDQEKYLGSMVNQLLKEWLEFNQEEGKI